jgi:lysine 2,3-aminomutase
MESWKDQFRSRITTPEKLEDRIGLTEKEAAYFDAAGRAEHDAAAAGDIPTSRAFAPRLPLAITEYYLSLSDGTPGCPIRRQAVPRVEELAVRDYELSDPLGEGLYTARLNPGSDKGSVQDPCSGRIPRLVHRYADRALLLVTDRCAVYCRHCFRRSFTGHGAGTPAAGGDDGSADINEAAGGSGTVRVEEVDAAASYLAVHPEIRELLLSGGDPLTLDDDRLFSIMERIALARPGILFRICSRMPAVLPARVTSELVRGLKEFFPVWLVTHFNHPREITPESSAALRLFVDAGIPAANQTVLLRGVNDDPATLYELNSLLLARGVKPLYLFQGDLAPGTAHLRVPLSRGLRIFEDLRTRSSGLALPRFAVDLPGGGGKVSLEGVRPEDAAPEKAAATGTVGWYPFRSADGKFYRYPEESEDMK